jgi:HlyD family secretion protein
MHSGQDTKYHDEVARRTADDSAGDVFGPQGAALILELQRLRRALESETHEGAAAEKTGRQPRKRPAADMRPQAASRKQRRKPRMVQVIDACLGQLGLGTTAAVRRKTTPQGSSVAPSHRRSPNMAPGESLALDLTKLAAESPEMAGFQRALDIEYPRLEPGRAATETAVGRLIQRCGGHLVAGTGFLLGRNAALPQDGGAGRDLVAHTGWSFDNELRTGLRVLLVAALLGGGWLAFVPLAGAVVVPGNLVVQSSVKTIQHPTGGIVAGIKVANGVHVGAGDLLLQLDGTQARANLQMVNKQLDELRARIARLVAERDGLERPQVPSVLAARSADDNVRTLVTSEEALFLARLNARRSQKDLLQSRIGQLNQEISGLAAQVDSKTKQLELIAGELTGVQDLYDKRLVPLARLTTLQRETARIEGEHGQLMSAIAETQSKIGEAQLQIVRLDQDFRTDVVKELSDTQAKEAEFAERSVAAQDQLDRIELRAPTSGVIHQLSVHTIGGVIRAGDTIMEIVPDADELLIEARLQPKDVDQVRPGQTAFVRFSAFNQRTTPQLAGIVSFVSADTSRDQQTTASFFTVRVVLPDEERRRLGGLQLVPGMPAEVFMQTGSRTMLSYLVKPITEQMHRAFVEH